MPVRKSSAYGEGFRNRAIQALASGVNPTERKRGLLSQPVLSRSKERTAHSQNEPSAPQVWRDETNSIYRRMISFFMSSGPMPKSMLCRVTVRFTRLRSLVENQIVPSDHRSSLLFPMRYTNVNL